MNSTIEYADSVMKQAEHLNVAFPVDCWELTVYPEGECWDMAAENIVTFDEADHMTDGYSLFESRVILARYLCPCDTCDI
jgi:hypothetical protein